MEDLERISKHLAENRLSQKEIYQILERHFKTVSKRSWVNGWLRRCSLTRASQKAHQRSMVKNAIEEDFATDFSKPLPPRATVKIKEDYKDVENLTTEDTVFAGDCFKKVKRIKIDSEGKYLIFF